MEDHQKFKEQVKSIHKVFVILLLLLGITSVSVVYLLSDPTLSAFKKAPPEYEYVVVPEEIDDDLIENGIHVRTGLVEAEGLMEVVYNCTNCHSAKLVIQNRMNKESWIATIRWMQKTQNLGELGKNEEIIVDYLVANYPPSTKGRREILSDIDWYVLKD